MTIGNACDAFLRDIEAQNLSRSSRANYKTLFRQLGAFARDRGLVAMGEIDTNAVRQWREEWTCAYSTQRQRLTMLKVFFSFAEAQGWISKSPLSGIRPPKSDSLPTMPLSADEVRAMLRAAEGKPKEKALLLLLRYSGLAIGDATRLERSAVRDSGELILRRSKSGEVVTVLLPPEAVIALDAIAEPSRRHYFWTGQSLPATAPKYWRSRLARIAEDAGVEGFHPHRLRDTFAVELLLFGVSMQDVSTLLGHSSVQTTERYYAPWNAARRRRLMEVVRKVHRQDPILLEFTPKKPAGAAATTPAEASLATMDVPKPTRAA